VRLLLIEDEPALARALSTGLSEEGYAVDVAPTLAEAELLAFEVDYDILVLDLMLPDGSGLDLLRRLRRASKAVPVLALTARDQLEDKVLGLDAGADDYLTKPFAFEELMARLRSLIRRRSKPVEEILEIGDIRLDRTRRVLFRAGQAIEVTTREFSLLEYLMLHAGMPLTRGQIAEHVWDLGFEARSNTIDVLVGRLRSKLAPSAPIRTLIGVGYVFDRPGDTAP
jgi:DNA-binding response OmpR family regulator